MPAVKPVIVVIGLFALVITPDPEIFVHVPSPPPVAVFAAITGAATPTHKVLLGPAFATWHCAFNKLKFEKERKRITTRHNLPMTENGVFGLILTGLEPIKSK
jgi:hypothetical protein